MQHHHESEPVQDRQVFVCQEIENANIIAGYMGGCETQVNLDPAVPAPGKPPFQILRWTRRMGQKQRRQPVRMGD
jgi:hypothetical protein